MRVIRLENSGRVYTSNVYLVLGDWSGMDDDFTVFQVNYRSISRTEFTAQDTIGELVFDFVLYGPA